VRSYVDQPQGWTHVPSPRPLPTNHDHDGGLVPIREYQSDQPSHLLVSAAACSASHKAENLEVPHLTLDEWSHIRSSSEVHEAAEKRELGA
jgi:hypothetical protein